MLFQSVIRAIYPSQCVACDALTDDDFGLCASCWAQTNFIDGLVCDKCGTPLPGADMDEAVLCDDCMVIARPWDHGRAVFAYSGVGRRLILGLKHADRTDLAPAMASWMAKKTAKLAVLDSVIVPIPLHWKRLARRRYNQSALIAVDMGKQLKADVCVDALLRPRATKSLDGHSREARFEALSGAIVPNPRRRAHVAGRSVLLVDDVMTSGATLAAATEALRAAGATKVSIVALARAVKET